MKPHDARRPRRRWRRRAISLIWTALCGLVFIGFAGLALDTANVNYAGQQLQSVADAASLAAARHVKTDVSPNFEVTRQAAIDIAAQNRVGGEPVLLDPNTANTAEGDIVIGRFNRNTQTFTPTLDLPNAVRVIARRGAGSLLNAPYPLTFASGFGVSSANVSRDAIATKGAGLGAGLIVLNRTMCNALNLNGGAALTVRPVYPQTCERGASIFVNSPCIPNAVNVPNNSVVQTTGLWIYGGFSGNPASVTEGMCGSSPSSTLIHQHDRSVLPLPDPLGCDPGCLCVPEPSTAGLTKLEPPSNNKDETIGPGWYYKGIDRTGGLLIMKPGVYILGDTDTTQTRFKLTGNSRICAKGVMIYIKAGSVDVTGGSGEKYLEPIDYAQPSSYFCNSSFSYPTDLHPLYGETGIIFFQSRSNTNEAKITGSSALRISGVLYFPSNRLRVSGSGFSLGTQVIVDSLTVAGNADIIINYDGRNPAQGATRVFLVE